MDDIDKKWVEGLVSPFYRQNTSSWRARAEILGLLQETEYLVSEIRGCLVKYPRENVIDQASTAVTELRKNLENLQSYVRPQGDAATTEEVKSLQEEMDQLEKCLKDLLKCAETNICLHEETHRGGAIWEICDICGMKWADDRGGKPSDAHEFPEPVKKAQDLISKRANERDRSKVD